MTGWHRPPCVMSFGRNIVNCGAEPASAVPTPAWGPTLLSVCVAKGPAAAGSDVVHVPIVQSALFAAALPPCETEPPVATLAALVPPPERPPPARVPPVAGLLPPVDASPPVAVTPPTAALPPVAGAPPVDGDPPTLLEPPVIAAAPPEGAGAAVFPPVKFVLPMEVAPAVFEPCEAPPKAGLPPIWLDPLPTLEPLQLIAADAETATQSPYTRVRSKCDFINYLPCSPAKATNFSVRSPL